jgi:hypothetical protein
MQTYVLRVYRARPADVSVSGMLEDIESGQKRYFSNLNDLVTVLAKTLGEGQFELAALTAKRPTAVAAAG